jgi:methylglyoxal synthase
MSFSSVGVGLVASRSLRKGENSPLVDLVRTFAPLLTEVMDAHIVAVGGTYDALRLHDVLPGHDAIERLPNGYLGGLVRLVGRVVDRNPSRALDLVIYLTDPTDPTSLYPEAQALQRECVVHGIPFLCTAASAAEWLTLKWAAARTQNHSSPLPDRLARLIATHVRPKEISKETIALIAHDSRKWELMQFVAHHHQLLSMFDRRVATGTTGALLNGEKQLQPEAESTGISSPEFLALVDRLRGFAEEIGGDAWTDRRRSGPLGGDAEIAEEILDGRCRRVIFFEDPHVARQHEADIQLLERAAMITGVSCLCLHSAPAAEEWACALEGLLGLPDVGSMPSQAQLGALA